MPGEVPTTGYARCGDVHIAFQVVGRGPAVVVVPGFVSNVEAQWEDPAYRSFIRRLARSSTVVRFDKRGTGLSDPVRDPPTLEEREADLAAVIKAAGVTRPVLVGISEGGPIAIRSAASMGTALAGLVLYATYPRTPPREAMDRLRAAVDVWGSGQTIELFSPSLAKDPVARAARGRFERESASPAMAKALADSLTSIDVSDLLTNIRVPTLVLVRRGDRTHYVEGCRHLAQRIATARLVELEGIDHLPQLGDSQAIVDEIQRFVRSVSADDASRAAPVAASGAHRSNRPASGWASLTRRELAVVALVAEDCSNPVIAQRLYIGRQTVETHLKHIFAKLGLESRVALARMANDRAKSLGNT